MSYDLRGLFDSLRVDWRDRGRNTSRDNVNISCPFCADDPGFHLRISEDTGAYYCLREPTRHKGRDLPYLVYLFTRDRESAKRLVKDYRENGDVARPNPEPKTPDDAQRLWNKFDSAYESRECLDYLEERGFFDAEFVARSFDLRYAPAGKWAGRLLIPLYDASRRLASWQGRAMRDHLDLKYLGKQVDDGKALFAGSLIAPRVVVVEGPIDALKINAAMPPTLISSVALAGKNMSSEKLLILSRANRDEILLALDRDNRNSFIMETFAEIKAACRTSNVRIKRLPEGRKDAGEMSYQQIREWLQ